MSVSLLYIITEREREGGRERERERWSGAQGQQDGLIDPAENQDAKLGVSQSK